MNISINDPSVKLGTGNIIKNKNINSISIGYFAGLLSQGTNSIAIGSLAGITNQINNSIVINSSGTELNSLNSSLYIKSIRNGSTSESLVYDTSTGEITSTNTPSGISNAMLLDNTQTVTGQKTFSLPLSIIGGQITPLGTYPRLYSSNQASSTFVTPGLQVGSGTSDGIYSSRNGVIDLGCLGSNYLSFQPQGLFNPTNSTNIPAIVCNQRIQIMNQAGAGSNPALQLDNQQSGIYRVDQGRVGIGISGTALYRYSEKGFEFYDKISLPTAPMVKWNSGGGTTGLYYQTNPSFSTNGTICTDFNSTSVVFNKGLQISGTGTNFTRYSTGTVTLTTPNITSNNSQISTVTFGTAFSTVPKVFAFVTSSNQGILVASALSPTTTNFILSVANTGNVTTTGSMTVRWEAYS